jgi:hypothetical protein
MEAFNLDGTAPLHQTFWWQEENDWMVDMN